MKQLYPHPLVRRLCQGLPAIRRGIPPGYGRAQPLGHRGIFFPSKDSTQADIVVRVPELQQRRPVLGRPDLGSPHPDGRMV
jgi:hypothetical protein